MSAIQSGFEYISKQVEDIRFLIEYEINKEHESSIYPDSFMNMITPLLSHEESLIDISWAIKQNDSNQAHVIFSWQEHIPKEQFLYPTESQVFIGNLHENKKNQTYELRIISPISDQIQAIQNTHNAILKGNKIAVMITEWNVATIIEQALKNTPVSAQDISFSGVSNSGKETLVYFHPSRSRIASDQNIHTDISFTKNFDFAGLKWKATYEAAPQFLRDFPIILAWQILFMGIFITFVLAWYLYKKGKYTESIEEQVRIKTQKLQISEAHFRNIVYGLQDLYYKTDLEGTILDVSPSVASFGYTVNEVLGTNMADYYADQTIREQLLLALQNSTNGKIYNYQFSIKQKDGSIRLLSTNSQIIYNEQGKMVGIEGTTHDLTEIKDAYKKMQHLDHLESLGMLAGGIAHTFNNVLTSIVGNASLACMQAEKDSPIISYMNAIEESSMNAANICQQMLAYAGKGKYSVHPINVATTIHNISNLIQASVTKNINLKYNIPKELPSIEADNTQIQQLIINLIMNAAEAYDGKRGDVSIYLGVKDLTKHELNQFIEGRALYNGQYVFIKVSDQASGISIDIQEKIFEPFFSTKFTGRGLGLSAVRGILRAHHGAIQIQSTKGKGSEFTVYIPVTTQT